MRDLHAIIAELQAALVESGVLSKPVPCGQITLNINDEHLASVHINAVHKMQGKPKAWSIPLRTGVLRQRLDTEPQSSIK